MPDESISTRLLSINAGVEYYKIYNSSLMNENGRNICDKAFSKLENLSFYVESTHGIHIHKLKAQAREMKKIMALRLFSLTILV